MGTTAAFRLARLLTLNILLVDKELRGFDHHCTEVNQRIQAYSNDTKAPHLSYHLDVRSALP
ncbi:MAG: hypothetical protein B7X71_02960 [Polynucleobacter sp. 39-46-10]|nr:MAG: hypothetical protein B7X71_02960 [Polynucleobacter sp. 39-46-10]